MTGQLHLENSLSSGEFIADIERAIRRVNYDRAIAFREDPNDLPSFADQGTSAPYYPGEEDAARNLLFETVANTRLNQW